jgi:integrase
MSEIAKHIAETIKQNRPNIGDSTIKTYVSLLTNVIKKLDSNTVDILNDTNKINDYVSKLTIPQTQKTLLSGLYVYTGNEQYKESMKQYVDIVNKNYAEKRTKDTRKEANIDTDKIKQIYENAKVQLKNNPSYENYIDYIIICLTSGLFIAPRRNLDWFAMKIKNIDNNEDNYIKGSKFMFNKFKTAKFATPEDKLVTIPKELKLILNKWKKVNPNEYLLFQKNNKPFDSPAFTKRMNKIYGQHVGVDNLRSIYSTANFGDVEEAVNKMQTVAKQMGTSMNSLMNYYIKDDIKN